VNFEGYLLSKKIDAAAFRNAEPHRWEEWNTIFVELSPASFTAQKLYLINPIRRKYPLKNSEPTKEVVSDAKPPEPKPSGARPMFKPKMN